MARTLKRGPSTSKAIAVIPTGIDIPPAPTPSKAGCGNTTRPFCPETSPTAEPESPVSEADTPIRPVNFPSAPGPGSSISPAATGGPTDPVHPRGRHTGPVRHKTPAAEPGPSSGFRDPRGRPGGPVRHKTPAVDSGPSVTQSDRGRPTRPVSPRTRMRQYRARIRNDPERHEQMKRKDCERYKDQKTSGIRKNIGDLPDREQRLQRRMWRKNQREHRKRVKIAKEIMTPPDTPEDTPERVNQESRQKTTGKKIRDNNRKKMAREIEDLKTQLTKANRRTACMKTRYYREKKRNKENAPDTPRTKTLKLLKNLAVPETHPARKQLKYYHSLINDLRTNYVNSDEKDKRTILQATAGPKMRKSMLQTYHLKSIGANRKPLYAANTSGRLRNPRTNSLSAGSNLRNMVVDFYCRDDVSRMTTGKKQTVTKNKEKQQKRILTDTLDASHKQFNEESPISISYAAFCRLRPFYVRFPTDSDRETCLCKKHENFRLLATAVFQLGVIKTNDTRKLFESVVCNVKNKDCMYKSCPTCKNKEVEFCNEPEAGKRVSYMVWVDEKDDSGHKQTMKIKKDCTYAEMKSLFNEKLNDMAIHVFNMCHQIGIYNELVSTLDETKCIVHCDFSENYTCGYSKEIQSAHFGGHTQASLHTGVTYIYQNNVRETKSFCTISDSNDHDPPAIWAHLDPILENVKRNYPSIKTVDFFSDGPTRQYKQKQNFHLLTKLTGFDRVAWHFFEAGHGKGAPDGVEAAVQRKADELRKYGKDVDTAMKLYEYMNSPVDVMKSKIEFHFISKENIEKIRNRVLMEDISTIVGTMKLHEVVKKSVNEVYVKDLSCGCRNVKCGCWPCKLVKFGSTVVVQHTDRNMENADRNVYDWFNIEIAN